MRFEPLQQSLTEKCPKQAEIPPLLAIYYIHRANEHLEQRIVRMFTAFHASFPQQGGLHSSRKHRKKKTHLLLIAIWAGSFDYRAAFELFDVDEDGNLTPDEINSIFIRYANLTSACAFFTQQNVTPRT